MMAGLNHEATEPHGRDFAINLEVTSNRPDCLGHIGIAREVAVLWNRPTRSCRPPRRGKAPPASRISPRSASIARSSAAATRPG